MNTSNTSLTYGGFGFGGAGLFVNDGYGGAGGGGWYGGQGTLPNTSGDDDKGGGGGSGFVYTKNTVSSIPIGYLLSGQYYLTQADTKQGTSSFISPNNTTEIGHSGDGYIRITVGENINDLRRRKSARIQQKGSSSTEWDPNAILLSREIGIETDTNKMKIGDGITPWSLLPYCNSSTSASDEEIKRIKYYGDPDIIPSDESYFTVNETGETITGLKDEGKTQTELVIPYKINGVEITKLYDEEANRSILYGNSVITKVVIPNSVTTIGYGAFFGCTSLQSINIPNSMTYISDYAFNNCTSLTSINIPNNVTVIDRYAFYGCTSLKSINIPSSVTSIEECTFDRCTSLTSINIPSSVTSIGIGAFMGCESLTTIDIPSSVTSIWFLAFDGCTNLTIYCEQGSYAESYAKENNIPIMYTNIDSSKYLTKDNTAEYAPAADYHPATKKYVDDIVNASNNGEAVSISTIKACTGDELISITSPIVGSIRYVSIAGTGDNISITPGLYFYLNSWKKVAIEDTAIISNEFVSGGDSTSINN